jgi:ubiquitin-like protein Pup
MTDRERIRRRRTEDEAVADDDLVAEDEPGVAVDSDEIDDLLEEIDSVLEENAEEFVRNYVQKGGE